MNILDINPEVLDTTAELIVRYCQKQQEIMSNYLQQITQLSNEWVDDETLGKIISEIKYLKNDVMAIMDDICKTYPRYFKEKADLIRNRPRI